MGESKMLFVYGTLREGMGNHYLLGGCSYMGKGEIQANLFVSGRLPMIYPGEGKVVGEVYEIDDPETAQRIDRLEGHPYWYERRLTDVKLDNGNVVVAWTYFMNDDGEHVAQPVEHGDYVKEME